MQALLDSGATECFIHPRLVQKYELKKTPLPLPRTVRNVDGTINKLGEITEKVEFLVLHNDGARMHKFLVADIGEDDLILGYPFLEAADPKINWTKGEMSGHVVLTTCSVL